MTRRPASLAIASVTVLVTVLAGPLHLLATPHVICPADGGIVRVEAGGVHGHGLKADADSAPRPAPGLPHRHNHEHPCAFASQLTAPGGVASPQPVLAPPPQTLALMPSRAHARSHRVVALIALAPSHSPPC